MCCREAASDCYYQATDMLELVGRSLESAEPGDSLALPARTRAHIRRRTHASHGGVKKPTQWIWVSLGVHDNKGAGIKKIRLMTSSKGFAVRYVLVSASRNSHPSRAELTKLLTAGK